MNILRVVYEWPPPWDGLASGPFELTRAQAEEHTIRVLCGGWPRHPTEILPQVIIHRLPSALPKLSLFASTAPVALTRILQHRTWADVIHGHSHLPIWYHLYRCHIGDKLPYFLHLHITAAGREALVLAGNTRPHPWTRVWEWPLFKWSDRIGCQVADAVICTSESVREEAIRFYGADPEKLYVISNGVNTKHFSSAGMTARQQYGLDPDDRVVLFVGSLSPRKRPDLLIEAMQRLPSTWKLLLVGRGPMESRLRSQVQHTGLGGRVCFAGYVPYPELPPLYRAADVLALLSEYEGFPKVVLEALACGVPVVTTSSFQSDECVRLFLTYPRQDTPVDVAMALQHAIDGPSVDVARIQEAYDWRVKARTLEHIYQKVANE